LSPDSWFQLMSVERWLVTGRNRFLLSGGGTFPPEQLTCVSGRLDDRAPPPRLDITSVRTVTE